MQPAPAVDAGLEILPVQALQGAEECVSAERKVRDKQRGAIAKGLQGRVSCLRWLSLTCA